MEGVAVDLSTFRRPKLDVILNDLKVFYETTIDRPPPPRTPITTIQAAARG
jgi:hypothetical protein